MTLIPKNWPDWAQKGIALFGSAGVGATIALTLIDKEHHSIVETFRAWGPMPLIGLVALVIVAPRVMDLGERMINSSEKNAASQQQLADAVQALVNKDDRDKEEQRRLLSYVGSQQEKILQKLEQMSEPKARGASA